MKTTHISIDDLILHYYREAANQAAITQHLADCAECAAEAKRLAAVLSAVNRETLPVPVRNEEYGYQVWSRIKDRLPEKRGGFWQAWLAPQRLAWAGGVAAVIILAFLLGRVSTPPAPPTVAEQQPTAKEQVRERIVLVAVGQHLEKSQMVLVELINAEPQQGTLDISDEQERARDLLTANRLYRQTAAQKLDDPGVRSLLDQLERALIEIANSPSELNAGQLQQIQQQIDSQGILFKMRVVGSKVKKENQPAVAAPTAGVRTL